MTTLQYLLDREQDLVTRREDNFNNRVRMLYKLDEQKGLTKEERKALKEKIETSESYEKALDTELKQVRTSMKRYILKILEG